MRVLLPLCLLAAVAAGCGAAASTRQHVRSDAAPVVHPAAPPKGFRIERGDVRKALNTNM